MGENFNVSKKVQEGGMILGALGVIGFIGIIWLMIYGNLSGNLGFGADSKSITNETAGALDILNDSGFFVDEVGVQGFTFGTMTELYLANGSNVPSDQFSVSSAGLVTNASGNYTAQIVNRSYSFNFDSPGKVNTEGIINNLTGGFSTFFGFSGTFFTIAAIVLLIFMLLGLLALVVTIMNMQSKNGGGFSNN